MKYIIKINFICYLLFFECVATRKLKITSVAHMIFFLGEPTFLEHTWTCTQSYNHTCRCMCMYTSAAVCTHMCTQAHAVATLGQPWARGLLHPSPSLFFKCLHRTPLTVRTGWLPVDAQVMEALKLQERQRSDSLTASQGKWACPLPWLSESVMHPKNCACGALNMCGTSAHLPWRSLLHPWTVTAERMWDTPAPLHPKISCHFSMIQNEVIFTSFFYLRWNAHNIKLTILNSTIQWHLAHLQCCATTTNHHHLIPEYFCFPIKKLHTH